MKTTYREALKQALRAAMQADPRVFLMGEDVGRYGGTYAVSKGLLEEFGPERIRDTPLSELGFVGVGIGAALGGMRPIVEVMTVNFSLLALDQIVNTAATLRHMSGGQFSVPLVVRMATGAGRQLAAQHSHSLENWYAHVPGIKVLAPATVADARGMLAPALADPDTVVIFEHAQLYNLEEEFEYAGPVDIVSAKVRRRGADVSLITYGGSLPKTLQARRDPGQFGHRRRGAGSAHIAAFGHRSHFSQRAQNPPHGSGGRRLAQRQLGFRDYHADRRAGFLRLGRTATKSMQRGSAHALCQAFGGGGFAVGGEDCGGGQEDCGEVKDYPIAIDHMILVCSTSF